MGIIARVQNYFTERRRSKLREDLKAMCEMDFQFNPFKHNLPSSLINEATDLNNLIERLVWYEGLGDGIYDFYHNGYFTSKTINGVDVNMKQSYFWVSCPPNMRHIHSGLPSIISDTMGRILFGNGFKIVAEIKDENNKVKEKESNNASELITELCNQLNLILYHIDYIILLDDLNDFYEVSFVRILYESNIHKINLY